MKILGLAAFHRDAAAALVVDGEAVAAEKEERFTKRPRDPSFPKRATRACLAHAGLQTRDLDAVVFYEKPLRKFERLLVHQIAAFPRSARAFAKTMSLWLGDRLWLKARIADELEIPPERVAFCDHMRAHAAAAFFTSPFERAGVLVVDDFGEWATTCLARGDGHQLETLSELHFPHSLGLVASTVAQFLGFEPGSDEVKVEALARLGSPRFARELESLVDAGERGSFHVDVSRLRFAFDGERLFDDRLCELLGPPRVSGATLRASGDDRRDADVAASLQALLERRVLDLARELAARGETKQLCFGGQVAKNRALNARLLAEGPFEELYVPLDPDDAGAALGAALAWHHASASGARTPRRFDPRLGIALEDAAHDGATALADRAATIAELCSRLLDGQRIAWVRGRADFGEVSAGARSLLADPRAPQARERLWGAVRQSESFLPPAIAFPAERADLVRVPRGAAHVLRTGWIAAPPSAELAAFAPQLCDLVWPLAIDRERDPDLHRLLTAFGDRAGLPVLLHASFFLRGSPIVRNESDALEAFERSALDALFVEDRVYERRAEARRP